MAVFFREGLGRVAAPADPRPINRPPPRSGDRARMKVRDRARADETEAEVALHEPSMRERDGIVATTTASRNALCRCTRSNGRIWVNNTAAMLFFGSTQNKVLAAPSQKNSPTAPEDSLASFGGATRTAKSMPKSHLALRRQTTTCR